MTVSAPAQNFEAFGVHYADLACETDDVLWNLAATEDDYLGLDHMDRSRALRNGTGDLFLR